MGHITAYEKKELYSQARRGKSQNRCGCVFLGGHRFFVVLEENQKEASNSRGSPILRHAMRSSKHFLMDCLLRSALDTKGEKSAKLAQSCR